MLCPNRSCHHCKYKSIEFHLTHFEILQPITRLSITSAQKLVFKDNFSNRFPFARRVTWYPSFSFSRIRVKYSDCESLSMHTLGFLKEVNQKGLSMIDLWNSTSMLYFNALGFHFLPFYELNQILLRVVKLRVQKKWTFQH